jgi:hypothetical protein
MEKSGTWTTITSLRYSRRRTFAKTPPASNNSNSKTATTTNYNNGSYRVQLHGCNNANS